MPEPASFSRRKSEPARDCSVYTCKSAGTVWATDGTGTPRPFCSEHGRAAGARRRCARCGAFKPDVAVRVIFGHALKPATVKTGGTQRLLCDDCVELMDRSQPELFGEA
jgi:hypothetical protein